MHIDQEKLIDLLADTAGMETDEAEKQLADLVAEIKEAIDEGEAYEVEGFGIFSGIGDNIIFIANKDLETEINYKYVGMEPIVLDAPAAEKPEQDDEEEEAGEQEDSDEGEYEDPFGFIYEDDDSEEDSDDEAGAESEEEPEPESEESAEAPEEAPGPDKWGIDSYKDDDSENVFSGLLGDNVESDLKGEAPEEDSAEAVTADEEEEALRDTAEDVFGLGDEIVDTDEAGTEEEPAEDVEAEIEHLAEQEPAEKDPGEDETTVSDLTAETAEEAEASQPEDEDPDEGEEEQEVVPIITNISSPGSEKKKAGDEKEKKPAKEKKAPQPKAAMPAGRKKKGAPVGSMLIIIVLLAGIVAASGYFGIIHIPGITPQPAEEVNRTEEPQSTSGSGTDDLQESGTAETGEGSGEQNSTDEPDSESETGMAGEANTAETANETDSGNEEDSELQPEEITTGGEQAPPGAASTGEDVYGLVGEVIPAANEGFTLVLFSLQDERNAEAKVEELTEIGYRAMTFPVETSQYGTLWRVSIGQFETLTDAANAANRLEEPYSTNYFITRIK